MTKQKSASRLWGAVFFVVTKGLADDDHQVADFYNPKIGTVLILAPKRFAGSAATNGVLILSTKSAYQFLSSVLVCGLIAGCATIITSRAEVVRKIRDFKQTGVQDRFFSEFRSFEEVSAAGDERLRQGDPEGAERLFRFALIKGEILQQKNTARAKIIVENQKKEVAAVAPRPEFQAQAQAQVITVSPTKELPKKNRVADGLEPQIAKGALSSATGPEGDQPSVATIDHCELLVGAETLYTVKKRETLQTVGARIGVSPEILARDNNIPSQTILRRGLVIKVASRHIIPKKVNDGLVINIPDRMLYYFRNGAINSAIPVTLGRAKSKNRTLWQTPTGGFSIVAKVKDPTWRVPLSIRKEMEEKGRHVVTEVAPGPANPLGKYAFRTSIPGIMIHSTNVPFTYGYNSHGCIRIFPVQMQELFKKLKVSTKGEIIYQPVKLAVTEKGRIFLEVHDDVYGKIKDFKTTVRDVVKNQGKMNLIDWSKVQRMVREKSGIAEDVSL